MKPLFNTEPRQKGLKYQQVVKAVINDIDAGVLRIGDRLPSLNEACLDWYISKDSIKRAYETLSQLGLITSINRKGYFISGKSNRRFQRVLMITGQLTESVKQLHACIASQAGEGVLIDICTYNHHQELLRELIEKHVGNYHYFLLTPHFSGIDALTVQCLKNLPCNQLILVGSQWKEVLRHGHQICYGSTSVLFDALENKLAVLKKYKKLNLVLPENDFCSSDYIRAFRQFSIQYNFDFELIEELRNDDIHPNQAYFVTDSADLIKLVDFSQMYSLTLGRDLGVISFTDNEYSRFLAGGISVISQPSTELGWLITQILAGQSIPLQQLHSLPLQLHFRTSC